MFKISRRDFLQMVALGMGSVALNRFLAACSPQPAPEAIATLPQPTATSAAAATATTGATLTPQTESAQPTSTGNKVLLVYFSRAGENYYYGERTHLDVGNTEVLAGMISQRIGCDVYQIEPVNPYPDDYEETVAQNVQEQESDARPAIANPLDSIDPYDIVLLGSPIWNVRSPMIMSTFVEGFDWTGKTIFPFTTHGGSGLGTTVRDYTASCPGATVGDGLAVRGEEAQDAVAAVESWLQRINLLT